MEKKKIYYIANARMPSEKAHGIQIAKMCEAFVLAGADLELVLPKRRGSGDNLKEFYGLRVEIPVRRLTVLNLGFISSSTFFACAYFAYLRGKKNAVVYTIDMDNFSFAAIRLAGFPYFSEIHDSKKRSFLWNYFFKKISGIITINNHIKNNLIRNFGLDEKNIIVNPNGIDLEMFSGKIPKEEARKKLGIDADKKIAVYVGREILWKGMEILSEAQKFLPKGTIKIINDRPYQEIPFWLSAADLLLVLGTKKNDYSYLYTSPMKIFEYMASGRPILASDTPANREILSENEAFFYEPDNAKDLAQNIQNVLSNPREAEIKTKNALEKAKDYTWQKRAKEILEFIQKND